MRSIRPGVVVALAATLLASGSAVALATSAAAADDPFPHIDTMDVPELDPRSQRLPQWPAQADEPALQSAQAGVAAVEGCHSFRGEQLIVERIAGANRYETAVCTSQVTWPSHDDPAAEYSAQAVVLARGDNFPDALAGGPLATYLEGPLLLTRPDHLPPVVMEEIQRVLAPGGTVYLVGGGSSVSNGIKSQLENAGYATKRLAGSNRYETAIAVAREFPDTSNFFFVTGGNFPDALAAGTVAADLSIAAKYDGDPETRPFALLLTNGDQMPRSTFEFADEMGIRFGVWTLITAGGAADRAAVDAFGNANLSARFVGSNRYQTATKIAEFFYTNASGVFVGTGVGLSTGLNFPDALSATVHLALWFQPLLLTDPARLSTDTRNFLQDHAGEGGYVAEDGLTYRFLTAFGGTSTISNQVLSNAEAAYTP